MNRQEIKDETRYITKTNTSTYTDADIESGLELIRKRIIMKAIRASTEWNLRGEIAQTDLVSITGLLSGENGYNGEYAFPSDLIKFTRIDLSYNGVTYNRATQYFMNDSDDSEETEKEIVKWMKKRVEQKNFTDAAGLAREFLAEQNVTDVLDPQFSMAMDAGFSMADAIAKVKQS